MRDKQLANWLVIDIRNQVPKFMERALLYDASGFGWVTGRMQSAGWYLEGELDKNCNITHWMKLPNPPKAESCGE